MGEDGYGCQIEGGWVRMREGIGPKRREAIFEAVEKIPLGDFTANQVKKEMRGQWKKMSDQAIGGLLRAVPGVTRLKNKRGGWWRKSRSSSIGE